MYIFIYNFKEERKKEMYTTKMKLLYIDDEPINLLLFEHHFNKIYDLYLTHSITDALDMIIEHKIVNIISDFRMPVMNGIEFINEVKKINTDTKCFILSAYNENDIKSNSDLNIIDGYIQKPYKQEYITNLDYIF